MRQHGPGFGRVWSAIFLVGVFVAALYVVLPYSSATELVLYDGVVALAVVVSLVGWHRAGDGCRLPWLFSSIALLGFLAGELIWWGYTAAGQDPFPSSADAFFLSGYVPLGIAAALLVSSRERVPDRTAWLDAGILTAVAGLLVWDVLMEPYASDPTADPLSLAATFAYPLADLLVLGLVLRLLFSPSARNIATSMFVVGVMLTLLADLFFAWLDLSGSFVSGSWVDACWLMGYLLMAFAPLHPAAAQQTQFRDGEGSGRGRLTVVLAAVLVPQLVLFAKLAGLDLIGLGTITISVLVSATVMVLVAARLWSLLGKTRIAEERRGQERLAGLILHSTDAIFVVGEECEITFASPSVETFFGDRDGPYEGRSLLDLFVEGRSSIGRQLGNLAEMPAGATARLEGRVRGKDGHVLMMEGTGCNLIEDESVCGIVITLRDVTARLELEEQLKRRALEDELTGLANRALFADRVAHALASTAREEDVHVAVLFIDLDDFKAVNDGMGHSAGDELLRAVAVRMRAGLRPGDTLARLGGDEFAVLLDRVPSVEYAHGVGERLLELLTLPLDVAGVSFAVPASVGVTLATEDSTVETLLRDADIAMYTAKSRGKGRIAMFDEALRERASQRMALKIELPGALKAGQFRLEYQPIVNLRDQAIIGFEALIRWDHPERGLVSPGEFIPAAEESGAIIEIGRWVLEQACRQAVAWNDASSRPLSMAVNVSAHQLHNPGFIDLLRGALETTGLPPALLTIEVTESVLVEHDRVMGILEGLRTIGVGIAIDDFGTGFSSLSYLQDFPVTSVKVDQSFVAALAASGDPGLVRSIISLAEALGLTSVAEGVETVGQLDTLTALECDQAQGYHLGYPQSPQALENLLPGLQDPATNGGRKRSTPVPGSLQPGQPV